MILSHKSRQNRKAAEHMNALPLALFFNFLPVFELREGFLQIGPHLLGRQLSFDIWPTRKLTSSSRLP